MTHGKFSRRARALTGLLGLVVGLLAAAPLGAEAVRIAPTHGPSPGSPKSTEIMHARYFSPILGRFLSVDPVGGDVGSSQSWNRYSYALNNPLRFVDPTGRAADDDPNKHRAGQGYATVVGAGMVQDSKTRANYSETTSQLAKSDHAGRNAAIAEARAASTPVGQNLAEAMKPTSDLPKYAAGTASKTNASVNEGMAAAGVAGKGILAIGATISVVNVANAPEGQRGLQASREVGGWTGALAFGAAGAKGGAAIGVFVGGPLGGVVGGAIGGIGGGVLGAFAGSKAGENIYEALGN